MDVTPQLIEQIDFSEKFRGYDPDQVDDFLEQVGATIATLQARVADLSERAERAEAEARTLREQPPPTAPHVMTDEEEAEAAARTLLLAKRTADAAIAEARQEATTLLAEARATAEAETREAAAEAERLQREAHARREEMIQAAKAEAEAELSGERERLTGEIAELGRQRARLHDDVAALEERISQYRERLRGVHESIGAILDDPSSLHREPPLDLADLPTASSPFYVTGSNPVVSVADPVTEYRSGPERVDASDVSVVSHPERSGEPASAPAPGDPWAPGSWSEVSASLAVEDDQATPFDGPPEDPDAPSPFDQATGGFQPADTSDRYLRDLDEAINQPADDEAMAAFFEAEDTTGQGRFGRRR